MKIVLIHGQNHRGSTCMIAQELADKVKDKTQKESEIKEYFLPDAFVSLAEAVIPALLMI